MNFNLGTSVNKPTLLNQESGDGNQINAPKFSLPAIATTTTTTTTTTALGTSTALNFGLTSNVPAALTTTTVPTLAANVISAVPAVVATTATATTTTPGGIANVLGGGTAAAATGLNLNLAPTLSSTTKTTDSANSSVNAAAKLTFGQIEEHINKWTLELEEQEKIFMNQATQLNAWDKLLIVNNDKILELNEAVQKVKIDQQTLEQELDFIATQHTELEESIAPLHATVTMNLPQVDVERTQTYELVENLDTQLKQMSEDIKEVIDYLNESSKVQDTTDPINQVGRILNAHMNSLQWIEGSSTAISTKLDDISKIHEKLKRDSERSFRATYNQLD